MHNAQPAEILSNQLHSERLAAIAESVESLLKTKEAKGKKAKLSRAERADIRTRVAALEATRIQGSVDFSRVQIHDLLAQRKKGMSIEFETMGPYLANYTTTNGRMIIGQLEPEDATGLRLASTFRKYFPHARLVSLYDDYNAQTVAGRDSNEIGIFSDTMMENFTTSLVDLLKDTGVIPVHAAEGEDYILVSERSKLRDAEILVGKLESTGNIWRKHQEIVFVNKQAENPLYQEFHLRTKTGKWLCQALDAASFLHKRNLSITHIVVLPDYMKAQQDKVWELLRLSGIQPERYHNLFYKPSASPEHVAQIIEAEFSRFEKLMI